MPDRSAPLVSPAFSRSPGLGGESTVVPPNKVPVTTWGAPCACSSPPTRLAVSWPPPVALPANENAPTPAEPAVELDPPEPPPEEPPPDPEPEPPPAIGPTGPPDEPPPLLPTPMPPPLPPLPPPPPILP